MRHLRGASPGRGAPADTQQVPWDQAFWPQDVGRGSPAAAQPGLSEAWPPL